MQHKSYEKPKNNKKIVNENPSGLSARQLYLNQYKPFMAEKVLERFPTPNYSSVETLLDTWQKHVPATQEIATDLLALTRTFIRLPNYAVMKNPQYLKALIKDIAGYLAEYFMRFENKEIDGKNRNIAKEKLMTILYDEFGLVQHRIAERKEHAKTSNDKKNKRQQAIRNGDYVPKDKRYKNSGRQLRETGVPSTIVADAAKRFSQAKTDIQNHNGNYNIKKK